MRKFSTIAGLFFCSLTLPAIAQDQVNVHWGPVIKSPSKTVTSQIIGSDKDGFYTLRTSYGLFSRKDSPYIERYDNKKSLAFSKQLEVPLPAKSKTKLEYQDIKYLRGQLVLFSSYLNKETDTYFSFANKVNKDGTVSPDMIELSRIEGVNKRTNTGNFDFTLSTDSSKILVFQNRPYEKNMSEKFDMKVFDADMQPVYYKSIELPVRDKDVNLSNYIVDNEGNTYVLMSINKGKEEKSRKEQNHFFKILAYFHKEGKVKEYDIKLPGKFVSDVSFILDKEQNLLVSGFYADSKKMQIGGLFFTKIDSKTQNVLAAATKDFTPQFLANFMKEKKANKDGAGVEDLKLKQLVLKDDGSVVIAAEQYYVIITYTQTKYGTQTTYNYYNLGMMFANISPKGELDWMTYVPKKQKTRNDDAMYNSFSLLVNGDKLRVIYNDNAKNFKVTDPKKMKYMVAATKAMTTLVTINNDGSFTKTPLFPAKEAKTIVIPRFYLIGNNNLTMYSQKGKSYRFGQIMFN